MSLSKQEQFEIGVLLPLQLSGFPMKKEDIMNEAEQKYFNTKSCADFTEEIKSGGNAGRKTEEWTIQILYKNRFIQRAEKYGYYEKNEETQIRLEDLAARIEAMINVEIDEDNLNADEAIEKITLQCPVLNIDAIIAMHKLYNANQIKILNRQAAAIHGLST